MPGVILVYTTVSSRKDAGKLGEKIVSGKFAACVNVFPIMSMYWWKGKIKTGKEYGLLFKTTKKAAPKLEEEIKRIHPYEVPCIIKAPAEAGSEFFAWLNGAIKNGP